MKELDEEIAQLYDKCTVCNGAKKNKTFDPEKGGWKIIDCMYCRGTGRESLANR